MVRTFALAAPVLLAAMVPVPVLSQSLHDRPWLLADVPIVVAPHAENAIEWDTLVTDPRVKAVVHKASQGSRADPAFLSRADEAKRRGLLWGAYHLGTPGDPIEQAEVFLELATRTGAKFLALDIEDLDPGRFMSLDDAAKFMEHIQTKTGRYPAVYANWTVYSAISQTYDKDAVFAKAPLWIARFRSQLGRRDRRVWNDYTLWQFSSEANCNARQPCSYRVPGTRTDMDLTVFNGDAAKLRALFE